MGQPFLTDEVMVSCFMASSSWSSFAALLPRFGLSGGVSIQVGGLGGGIFSTSMSTGGYSNGRYIFGIGRLLGTWADHVLMAMASEGLSGCTCLVPSPAQSFRSVVSVPVLIVMAVNL